ncbi:MAG TPA: hypothetical protein VI168_01600 [Croceibacterium sp.]
MSQHPIWKSASESWENEGGTVRALSYAESLGVTRVLTETFKVGGYSYTTLADAVAQARRMQAPGADL